MKEDTDSVFEPGDIVLFQIGENRFKNNIGMILRHKENGNYIVLDTNRSAYKDIKSLWISSIYNAENIRNEIISYYEDRIAELQSQIRKPTQEEKCAEKIEKYNNLKEQILSTAKHMINCECNHDFENKLKAIADMKCKIFSIELECASDIRKKNGMIKWKIREEKTRRDVLLRRINDENIKNAFNFE